MAGSKQETSGNGDHPPNKRMRTSGGNHGQKPHASFAYQASNNHHQQSHSNHQTNRSSGNQRQTGLYSSPANQFLPQPRRF